MTFEELRERKTPLQARQRAIQSELRALKAAELDRGARLSLAETTERSLGRLRKGAKSLALAERQRIVRLLVREVRVGKDEVMICHSVPMPTPPPQGSGPSGAFVQGDSANHRLRPRGRGQGLGRDRVHQHRIRGHWRRHRRHGLARAAA